MNGFEKQELETQGMMSRLFGSKPGHNALVEINNFLAAFVKFFSSAIVKTCFI